MNSPEISKPWYASQSVWGGIAAIGGGLGTAFFAYQNHDIASAMAGLMAAAGGLHAIVGRIKADTPIANVIRSVDGTVQDLIPARANVT